MAGARVPIFLIHGENDDNIPIRHAALLREANRRIQFWAAPNVGHWSASSDNPEEYRRRVLEWFAAHREPGGAAAGN
jgi:dipeptidyl aminopeptidase/acylaminoacyl peptidase